MSTVEPEELDEAFAALRDAAEVPSAESVASTRRAVLLGASRLRRRSLLVRIVLPLAALIGVSTAWAAAGQRVPNALGLALDRFFFAPPQRSEDFRAGTLAPSASSSSAAPAVTEEPRDPVPVARVEAPVRSHRRPS